MYLDSAKKLRLLQHNLFKSIVIVLCNWRNLLLGHVPSDVVAMTQYILTPKLLQLPKNVAYVELWWQNMLNYRGLFRTQSTIYDGALLQKQLTAKRRELFPQKIYELQFKFEKTPLTKYANACVAKSSFLSKFKVFMTASPKSIKPVKLPVFNKNQIFFYFHFVK